MNYWNMLYHKSSKNVSCRDPWRKDPLSIDYDQDSEEEWNEINAENLEDDNLLMEEDGSEINGDAPELQ